MTHWRGHSSDMYGPASYGDVVAEVRAELAERVAAAVGRGVDPAQIIVDPGLGFAKLAEHNWTLLANLTRSAWLPGYDRRFPVLVAASRKRFLGTAAGRAGRRAAVVRRQRRRDDRRDRPRGRRGRVVRPRARGAGQPGRGAGGDPLAAGTRQGQPGDAGQDHYFRACGCAAGTGSSSTSASRARSSWWTPCSGWTPPRRPRRTTSPGPPTTGSSPAGWRRSWRASRWR